MPHVVILLCNMYIVLYLIDRVNPAMNFIDNGLTKSLLLLMCAVALYNARQLLLPYGIGRRGARRADCDVPRPAHDRYDAYRRGSGQTGAPAGYREPDRYGRAPGRYEARSGYDQRTVSTAYARQSRYSQPDRHDGYPRRRIYDDREGARR